MAQWAVMKKPSPNVRMNRRHFLAATGWPWPRLRLSPSAPWPGGRAAASERVTVGVVGWGVQGPNDTGEALKLKDCQVVAACDLDANHLRDAVNKINGHSHQNRDCRPYHDYRELMARGDIDAVILAVPDSWHALVATEAARNKKDIYGEKPLARTIAEQRAIVRAVTENDRIWQTGSGR